MGGAIFKALEMFYGTNDFSVADASIGVDPVTGQFELHSNEAGSGGTRDYVRFTQVGPLGPGLENSPEGENGMSRIYLGIHWLFDQQDGIALGNAIAQLRGDQPLPGRAGAERDRAGTRGNIWYHVDRSTQTILRDKQR